MWATFYHATSTDETPQHDHYPVVTTIKEKDLGLTFIADMKESEQCGIAAAKGNQILGLIRRKIVYKEKNY